MPLCKHRIPPLCLYYQERLDMDALQPALLTCQSAVLNKKVVLPAIGKTQQRPLRLAGDLVSVPSPGGSFMSTVSTSSQMRHRLP